MPFRHSRGPRLEDTSSRSRQRLTFSLGFNGFRGQGNAVATKKKDWVLTGEALHAMLQWLDSDPNRAGSKYEDIRRKLIFFFESHHCLDSEHATDETIDRVARKICEGLKIETPKPYLYFYGVALRVLKEHQRRQPAAFPPPLPDDPVEVERRHACMERCLAELPAETRKMLTEYCQIDHRLKYGGEEMAHQLGISVNALRLRVHRAREGLAACVEKCRSRAADLEGSGN
jgi:DNA-directed RNA polymerase specialized sigma24 family protein